MAGGEPPIATLRVGLSADLTWEVTLERTAAAAGHSSEVTVLATPQMGLLVELACAKALEGTMEPGMQHVGTLLQVRHLAATPVGGRVTARVELTEIDGKRLTFRGDVVDEVGKVGEALHERAVVRWSTLLERLEERRRGGA